MKYILAIGVGFKKWRKPLKIRIRSKYFIDEIVIDQQIDLKDKWKWNKPVGHRSLSQIRYDIFDMIQGKHPLNGDPEKLFFYEIADKSIGDKIKLDVDCKDNNYTNGFMTKTALMTLRTVHLLPKPMLKVLLDQKNQHRAVKRMELKSRFPRPDLQRRFGTWPCQKKSWVYNVDDKEAVISQETRETLEQGIRIQDDEPIWIGGKFSIEIPILKKLGFKMIYPYHKKGNQHGKIITNFYQWKQHFQKYYDINITNENQ